MVELVMKGFQDMTLPPPGGIAMGEHTDYPFPKSM
jgi:hypothetical protein